MLLPILGDRYGRVLENGDLVLELGAGAFSIRYHDTVLPVEPRSTIQILARGLDALSQASGGEAAHLQEYQSIITALGNLPAAGEAAPERVEERAREKEVIRRRLASLVDSSEAVGSALDEDRRRLQRAPRRAHRASTSSTICSASKRTGSPTGGWRERRSTTGASST